MNTYLLQQLLRSSTEAAPRATAVVDGDRSLTYGELEADSSRLAHSLRSAGVARGDRVGLYLEKSPESIVGIYGILKAGACYVPLDPQAPVARLGYIAADCGLKALVSGRELAGRWAQLKSAAPSIESIRVLNADGGDRGVEAPAGVSLTGRSELRSEPAEDIGTAAIGDDLAYILYTSGSTGRPKGVMLSHRNALAFVEWAGRTFGVGAEDTLSSHAPFHFDLSVFDLFAAAWGGARVVLVPPAVSIFPTEVARFIDRHGITVWYSVPSLLSRLAENADLQPGALPSLRTVLFAGEVFPVRYLRRLMRLLPDVRFANLYGPTETNVCTWYDVPAIPESQVDEIPIGKAIDDVDVFAVAESGDMTATGEVGELHVRGATVMQGYWGDPERTARSLVPDPRGLVPGALAYRTGDLVRMEADGSYRYLGRRDSQVKSRGYRIELGEVESALYRHPAVKECAVLALPDELAGSRLVAVVAADPGVARADLVRWCAELIPRYMIPEQFEFKPSLPKTSTGKTDRQLLTAEIRDATTDAAALKETR